MPKPLVSLTKQSDYEPETLKQSIIRLLAPLGGMMNFVHPGQRVLLKLNLVRSCAPGMPAHTQPEVFRAVAELAQECGGIVVAGDSPGLGSARKVAENAGIAQVADEMGIQIIEFSARDTFDETRYFKKLTLAGELFDADVVINLPRLKTHVQMMLTAAVKNLFGAVVGPRKFEWHFRAGENKAAFARMIYEICMAVKPQLHILDAVVAMDGFGPTSGRANNTGFMGASIDPVALDAVMMQILGREPEQLYTIAAAVAAGNEDWRNTEITGACIEELHPKKWLWPRVRSMTMLDIPFLKRLPKIQRWLRRFVAVFPSPNKAKCKKCGACVKVCPAQAMSLNDQIEIDYDKCIRCYCCHELCPYDALDLRGGLLSRVLRVVMRS